MIIFKSTLIGLILFIANSFQISLSDSNVKSSFSCVIDGKSFDAAIAFAAIENQISDGIIQIIGQKNNDVVELVITQSDAKEGASIKADGGLSMNGVTYAIDESAKVVITKHTATQIAGTFTLEAVDDYFSPTKKVKITQGKFDVAFQ